MNIFNFIYDNTSPSSLASKSRQKRFEFFMFQLEKIQKPIKILDIGGTEKYWYTMNFIERNKGGGIIIYLLNLKVNKSKSAKIISIKGDATNLKQFGDNTFDMVFSNSVIEHLYTWENQIKMAKEVQRVGKNYFIQTPNYWFPIEPHFVFPFFQYLPKQLRIKLIMNFNLGHFNKFKNKELATQKVEEISLISLKKMKELFPTGKIYLDKFIGLNKSIVAYRIIN